MTGDSKHPPAIGADSATASAATPAEANSIAQLALDRLETAWAYAGGQTLDKPGLGTRRRTRIDLPPGAPAPRAMYLKRYGPPGLREMLARAARTGRWVSAAVAEADAIQAIARAGVPTMRVLAAGQEGKARPGRSFLLVSAVPGDALERCAEDLLTDSSAAPRRAAEVTADLAALVARLHAAGWVHRDLYASHIFAAETTGQAWHAGGVQLWLIDLARAFRPVWRRRRWRVKDLAQLKYSMPVTWVETWWQIFLEAYLRQGPPMSRAGRLAGEIDRKVARMRRRAERRRRREPGR